MKTLLAILSLSTILLVGCTSSKLQQDITKEKTVYTGVRADKKLLGIRIACSEMRTEWGYTEEICGEDWGKELYIDWGTND